MKKTLMDITCLNLENNSKLVDSIKKTCFYENNLELDDEKILHKEIAVDNDIESENNINEEEILKKFNLGNALLKDYEYIDAYKVNSENIDDINELLKGKGLVQKADLKKEANLAAINLIRINEGNGTIFNYEKFKINIVSSYLTIINKSILKFKMSLGRNLSVDEIRKFVSKIIGRIDMSIKKINEGNGTESDYENIGINDVDAEVLLNINKFLKNKNLRTPNKIRFEIERFFNAVEKISMGSGTISNYNAIGIKLDGKKIKIINSILKGIYERDNENLTIKEVLDIGTHIMNNLISENTIVAEEMDDVN